jgi:hypothetical protein
VHICGRGAAGKQKVNGKDLTAWLAERKAARRAAEVLFRALGRRHLARFDDREPGRCQDRILTGLLHQARATRFGRDHDFRRIRTATDFRRLVPLRSRAELWRDYWEPAFPDLGGTTWPGPLPPAAAGPRPLDEVPRPVCLSAALHAAHRAALRTAVSLAVAALPRVRFSDGRFLVLHDDDPAAGIDPGRLTRERVPALLRPFTLTGFAADAPALAERAAAEVTCAVGPAEGLLALLERVEARTGKPFAEAWPLLRAVVYTSRSSGTRLRAALGPGVLALELFGRPEGVVAVEDPRYDLPRLLPDHGLYFEFVPVEELGLAQPRRLGLDELELGMPVELVLTSPAGLWACRTGRALCLEGRDPPLVRFLEGPAVATAEPPRRDAAVVSYPAQAPHRQSAGTPATLPGMFGHTLWSALVGPG